MAISTTPVRKWYVLRTFSGHEKKVKEYLESEVERLGMEEKLARVLIPTETVFEMRG
ncbi:MAG: transcription termination/antitermination factor NusG, partial [Bacteroidetes bacterium]|nr:transcription termination/antitermination factor NusG [Bacteroidota bacterium]